MTIDEKISKTLTSTKNYLEDSMKAVDKKSESLLMNNVWHVGAELEYALFLLSMKFQDEIDKSKWKPNPKLKKVEIGPMLVAVHDLLTEAEKCTKNKELQNAFRSVHIARSHILKVQKDFVKKRREALKQR